MDRGWKWLLVAVALFFAVAAAIRVSTRSERTRTAGATTASGGQDRIPADGSQTGPASPSDAPESSAQPRTATSPSSGAADRSTGNAEAAADGLNPGVRLFGWVSRGGRPVTETQVSFSPEHGADVTTTFAKTDAQGNYEVRGVPTGSVMGRVGDHDYRIWVPEGLDELRFDIPLAEGVVSGRVYQGSQRRPAQAADVQVYRSGDPKGDLSQHAARWVTGTTTDVEGRYELTGLQAGEYWIHVVQRKHGTKIHGPVRLPERGGLEGVDIYLGDSGMIAGFVLDSTGLPIMGAAASVRQIESGEPVLGRDQRVVTNEHGLFLVEGVPPGRYRVTTHARGKGQQSKTIDADEGAARVEFLLSPEGFVRVQVKDASGNPVEHAVLVVWDASGEPVDPAPGDWGDPLRTQTDRGGFLTRGGLASGDYRGEVASSRGRATFGFSIVEEKTTNVVVEVKEGQ